MKSTIEALLVLLALASPLAADPLAIAVPASTETVGVGGDADDPAIWVNPTDPAQSLILGTDKQGGLFVYGLDGTERAFLPDGRLNNVDVRPFMLGGKPVALAGASKRDDDTLVFYIIDSEGVRHAEPFAHPAIPADMPGVKHIYGFAMAQDASATYALVNFKSGDILQYRIEDQAGQLRLTLARQWKVGSQPEGMVADDRAGHIYVGEEDIGIWRYPLDPALPAEPLSVATIPSACLPRDDVEGLAVHESPKGRYLVASAQGIHRAAIFLLDGEAIPACTALVEIAAGAVDGVTETDGLDVTSAALPGHPEGVLVMMDDQNAGYTTNFKVIDWAAISANLP
ncbi:phytase [Tabrizicola sp.]|uniref:phytase n=1 Tax=Tabrizicola sp. TaxID=2005166 RepID=UPI003F2C293D